MHHLEVVVPAALGAACGIVLWLALLWRNRISAISPNRLLLIAVVVGAACRIAFAILTPTFYAPDEQSHFKYISYLSEERSLPIQTSKTGAPANDWEYYQPPLYYLLALPAHGIAQWLSGDERLRVRAVRLLSIALWLVAVLFALRMLDSMGVRDTFLRTCAMSIVCLLPTYTFLSSAINNDNLLTTLGCVLLWLLSKERSLARSSLMGLLLGLALLTKMTAVVYFVAVITVIAADAIRGRLTFRQAGCHIALVTVLAGVLWLPWLVRNVSVYGDPTAERIANVPRHWPSAVYAVAATLNYTRNSFWAVSGIRNNVSFLPSVGLHFMYLALLGFLYARLSRDKLTDRLWATEAGGFVVGTAVAIGVNVLLVLRFGVLYGQGQGRFLYPMLVPIALYTATGIRLLRLERYSRVAHLHAAGILATYVLSFTCFSLAQFARVGVLLN